MDSNMTFRMDSDIKQQMSVICKELGMTTSTAFNLFTNDFARAKGIPFPVTIQTKPAEHSIQSPQYVLRCKPLEVRNFANEIEKIARLGYGLASNHAFVDGNKRIGALMTQLLLQWNGYLLELKAGELADVFISVADNAANETDLLEWIRRHLK